ncbi:hypothetical protein G6F57_010444 [Rhizopus arrhizus]|uniref:Uncharacterized protein n=1 Tax=Rhizopus oryzae TaxID=64495 RepID=A0A9P7BNL1_RHIOR|nr:hypothetical protein G6F23_006511 [Rhizopus arrhizus]KAG1412426.1 hypothetical protein G6F58_008022 [Rhizopus delemar]KAG0933275.1 hypothetical protein G6F30_010341 [Rhizopus arrhizus]KAG0980533.1 hypothetical protein G6F29_007753 [Rhizopus arrhizus]KAG0984827.1 hypothetical protein G6F28_010617 [Rhizopus arrhizus]
MSDPAAKEHNAEEEHQSYKPVYEFHFYFRLHLLWALAIISIFLGQAWWLIPLPGDSLLPRYRTYPASILKGVFEGLVPLLVARSLVVALIKVFTNGVYPDSVIKFRSTGGVEAIYSGLRYRSGLRYLAIASLIPIAFLIGNLLQAEFQSSTTVFYHLQDGSSNMEAAQCQHSTPAQYDLASKAFSSGLISNSLADASSILDNFNQPNIPNFGVSLISSKFTPVSNISVQAPNHNILARRHHNLCDNDGFSNPSGSQISTTQSSSTTALVPMPTDGKQNSKFGSSVPTPTSVEEQSVNSPTVTPSSQQTTDASPSASSAVTSAAFSDSSNNNINSTSASGIQQNTNNAVTSSWTQHDGSNITTICVDNNPITNFTAQMQYLETLAPITINNTNINGTATLYILRYSSVNNGEAIIIISNPPEYYKAGFYVSAQTTNYTCFSGNATRKCDRNSAVTFDANNKVVADALAEAMRSNAGLYGTAGMISDVLSGHYNNDTKLADALFVNPLCSDLSFYPTTGHILYPYTRATWTILAIIWAILLIIIWAIGAYLIGYTIDVFCHLTQYGNLIPQIITNSTIFIDNEQGTPIRQEMFLNWEEVELLANRPVVDDDHNHGYTVTTEEL